MRRLRNTAMHTGSPYAYAIPCTLEQRLQVSVIIINALTYLVNFIFNVNFHFLSEVVTLRTSQPTSARVPY